MLFTIHQIKKKQAKLLFYALTRNKPCSVENNHLSTHFMCPAVFSFQTSQLPYQIWVSRLWGLPVPPRMFPFELVSVALSNSLP